MREDKIGRVLEPVCVRVSQCEGCTAILFGLTVPLHRSCRLVLTTLGFFLFMTQLALLSAAVWVWGGGPTDPRQTKLQGRLSVT